MEGAGPPSLTLRAPAHNSGGLPPAGGLLQGEPGPHPLVKFGVTHSRREDKKDKDSPPTLSGPVQGQEVLSALLGARTSGPQSPQSTSPRQPRKSSSVLCLGALSSDCSPPHQKSSGWNRGAFRRMRGSEKDHIQLWQPGAYEVGGAVPCVPLKGRDAEHPEEVGGL